MSIFIKNKVFYFTLGSLCTLMAISAYGQSAKQQTKNISTIALEGQQCIDTEIQSQKLESIDIQPEEVYFVGCGGFF